MTDILFVADHADMIINGYAFTEDQGRIRILNLNDPEKAMVIRRNGTILETSMDDMESGIACRYYLNNRKYMENPDAEIL